METGNRSYGNNLHFKFFIDDKLMRSINIDDGLRALKKLMKDTTPEGNIAFLPDFTPANSLPVGTSFLLEKNQKLNPSWIGMDIGCGYNLFELDLNLKKVLKNGRINHNRLEKIVNAIDSQLHITSKQRCKTINLPIENIQNSANRYLGTLGHGNHFIDIFYVEKVIDSRAFNKSKLDKDKLYFLIHSGSREMGFKTHGYFAEKFKLSIDTLDFNTNYLKGLRSAIQYAKENRRSIADKICSTLGNDRREIFDQDHNAIDECNYFNREFLRIRKGATLIKNNSLAIIPSSCNESAYLMKPASGILETYNTLPHGTGRKYTRAQLFSKFARSKKLADQFKGIMLNVNPKKMVEEVPAGYKSIQDILKSIKEFDLATPVAKLNPLAVIVDRD